MSLATPGWLNDGSPLIEPAYAPSGDPAPPTSRTSRDGLVLGCAGHDNTIRWREGDRLEQLFEHRCDELRRAERAGALAVDGPDAVLSYAQLDARANQVARFLSLHAGVRPGERVALLFEHSADSYVAMLAVLKVRAAYVPLDPAFPRDRVGFIVADAGVSTVLSRSALAPNLVDVGENVARLYLDELEPEITSQPEARLGAIELADAVDDLCYLIYTSGTTGRPKGVAVGHASICNFVQVAAEVYGITAEDRVYQGLTIAFDFSIEEIWVAWMAGATLVPRPSGGNLVGPELKEFLSEHRVSALCCVPTLLATLDDDLPELRFLLVSGESCPHDVVVRWHRPGRRFLNVYGPTETTVSATWTLLHPDRPVTIGVPLPTYSAVILDPAEDRALLPGAMGELGIAGIGVAEGYLGLPERTERAFVPDFLDIPGNPTHRIYRTGDLCRINENGEIEHHGRIDTQVKVRGYRIELGEIESVLRQVPGIAQAIVAPYAPEPGVAELVGYYTERPDGAGVDLAEAYEWLRDKLPAYMVPAYLERLEALPVMTSGKADRNRLPAPRGARRPGRRGEYVPAASEAELVLAGELAKILGVERVSVESDFFDELGANSLLMARFNAALRHGGGGLRVPSMRDVYRHPTVRRLAEALSEATPEGESTPAGKWADPVRPAPMGTPHYLLCGALQLLAFLAYVSVAGLAFDIGASWLTGAHGALDLYARAVVFGGGALLGMGVVPILAKWVLIGRFRRQAIRVWSLAYVRFWIVKTLIVANPLARLCVGTAFYGLYLRALGAKIGKGTVIFTTRIPVCADLVSVGAGSVIRKDTFLNGYRARAGVIELGPISLGNDVLVGEHAVLDIDTALEDGAQLGHTSSLQAGQVVPAGECWHGSPARAAGPGYSYRTVPPAPCSSLRRARHSAGRLLLLVATVGPIEAALATLLLTHPGVMGRLSVLDGLLASGVLVLGLVVAALVFAAGVPRLLTRALQPGNVYPLYGVRFSVQRLISRASNNPALTALFGDSSAIVHYLRALGWRLGAIEQTGSNFGTAVKQEVPGLSQVGSGTMVSDGLSMMNVEFSSSSFRVMPVKIGRRNYLGNDVVYPANGRTGDNCLLASKVMIPTAGPVRENVGLLGSPCFEIPRTVQRDKQFDHLATGAERRRRLAAKNRHNLVTAALHLMVEVLLVFGLILLAIAPLGGNGLWGWAGTVATTILELVFVVAFCVLVERAAVGARALRPRCCSIYQVEFWRHERYWKVASIGYIHMFDGTPFKSAVWRLLGVGIGRRVFDDGCVIVERSLVDLSDEATLNMGCTLQSHTLEEGAFKSDRIAVGRGCTVSTGALVNYGVVMEGEVVVEADSFLMKGSHATEGSRWRGNPAQEVG